MTKKSFTKMEFEKVTSEETDMVLLLPPKLKTGERPIIISFYPEYYPLTDYTPYRIDVFSDVLTTKIHITLRGKKIKSGFSGYYLPFEGDTDKSEKRFNEGFGPLPDKAVLELPSLSTMVLKLKRTNHIYFLKIVARLFENKEIENYCNLYPDSPFGKASKVEKDEDFIPYTEDLEQLHNVNSILFNIKLNLLTRAIIHPICVCPHTMSAVAQMLNIPNDSVEVQSKAQTILSNLDIAVSNYYLLDKEIANQSYSNLYIAYTDTTFPQVPSSNWWGQLTS